MKRNWGELPQVKTRSLPENYVHIPEESENMVLSSVGGSLLTGTKEEVEIGQ